MSVRPHRFLPIAALALGLMLGGCFTQNYQRGYILAEGALEQIPLGAPQEQVLITLGTPSTVATVSGEVFYYISKRTEQTSFLPAPTTDPLLLTPPLILIAAVVTGRLAAAVRPARASQRAHARR